MLAHFFSVLAPNGYLSLEISLKILLAFQKIH